MSGRRLTARDYKSTHRAPLDLTRWKQFGLGLAAGLVVAGVVFVADHRLPAPAPPPDRPTPHNPAHTAADAAPAADSKFDFYQMLPKFEVVVPEKKESGKRVAPTAQISQPGLYFLQAGSYKSEAEANRVRAQLAKLGIDAAVQRVAVDTDVWHRVRVGPIRDLKQLNRLRSQLSAIDVDSLVIRVDE